MLLKFLRDTLSRPSMRDSPSLRNGSVIGHENFESCSPRCRMARLPGPQGRGAGTLPLKSGGWDYFFDLPRWTRDGDCPAKSKPLGTDYALDLVGLTSGGSFRGSLRCHTSAARSWRRKVTRNRNRTPVMIRLRLQMLAPLSIR
jgi:hypothetical protein